MLHVKDQTGCPVTLHSPPKRIVSLVPSITETLFDLGLENEIAGITQYCIHPHDKVKNVPVVGGPADFSLESISRLSPDLIIGNREENRAEGIERLRGGYPVWMSDVTGVQDALSMISSIALICGCKNQGESMVRQIQTGLDNLRFGVPYRVIYLIWKDPYIAAGGDTFIDEMLRVCGFVNVLGHIKGYPRIKADELKDADILLFASEPYPFSESEIRTIDADTPDTSGLLVDGTMFSWYGSRIRLMPEYYRQLRGRLEGSF